MYYISSSNELYHYGIKGQKWGVRRYQNEDGTLTSAGRARYGVTERGLHKYVTNNTKHIESLNKRAEKISSSTRKKSLAERNFELNEKTYNKVGQHKYMAGKTMASMNKAAKEAVAKRKDEKFENKRAEKLASIQRQKEIYEKNIERANAALKKYETLSIKDKRLTNFSYATMQAFLNGGPMSDVMNTNLGFAMATDKTIDYLLKK